MRKQKEIISKYNKYMQSLYDYYLDYSNFYEENELRKEWLKTMQSLHETDALFHEFKWCGFISETYFLKLHKAFTNIRDKMYAIEPLKPNR